MKSARFSYTCVSQSHSRTPNLHLVPSKSVRTTAVTLLGNRELDALALRQADPRLLTTNDAVI